MRYTPSQTEAIYHESENILVSASAGSGKTGVLKARVLRKLSQGIHIDQLIVLTFTKAAAEEMKSRIIDELKAKNLKTQMIKLDNAIISTFDAFTLRLVKEYHYLLKLPSDIQIVDPLIIQMESQKVLESVIENFYRANDIDFNDMIKMIYSKNDDFLAKGILSLAKAIKKIPNYKSILENYHDHFNLSMLDNAFENYMDLIRRDLSLIYKNYYTYMNQYKAMFSEECDQYLVDCQNIYLSLLEESDNFKLISKIIDFKLPTKPRKPKEAQDWLPSEENRKSVYKLRDELSQSQVLTESDYKESWLETRKRTQVILNMVRQYLHDLENVQKEKHLYSYDDIMNFAIQLLLEQPHIRDYYQKNINEILVDEYQDTNDLQDYFISLISKNNSFMVGDVKQSIYRFRDANPKNFMNLFSKYSLGKGGKAIRLKENFRSNKFLLKEINQLFFNIMTKDTGGVDYIDNHALESGFPDEYGLNKKNQPMNTLFYDLEQILEANEDIKAPQVEAMILANDILRKIKARQSIFDGKEFRPLDFKDISILVDRKTNFPKYKQVLSDYGIPVQVYSDESFTESEEIIFLNQFLILIECFRKQEYKDQYFKRAFYSVARSFVYQIDDQTIIHYLIHEANNLEALDLVPKLKKIKDDIMYLLPKVDVLPNGQLMDDLYLRLDIYKKIALLEKPASKEKKLDFFRHLINGRKESDFSDLLNYFAFIQENQNLDIEYSEIKEDTNAVKLMSIHKSKGLQFPIVYMIGLKKRFNLTENKDIFNFSSDYGILTHSYNQGFYRNFLENLYLRDIKNENDSEKIRLLYVALTRAKEEVNFILEKIDSVNEAKIGYNNYLEILYKGYNLKASDIISHLVLPEKEKPSLEDKTKDTLEHSQFDFIQEERQDLGYSKSTSEFLSDQAIQAIAYGNEIHEILENIDFNQFEKSINSLPPQFKESFKYLWQTSLFRSFENPQFYQEYEFVEEVNGRIKNGIIDLLIMDNEKTYIIDYKLKNIDDQAYTKQLLGYKAYMETMTSNKVQCYLYSLIDKTLKKIQ